MQLCRQVNPQCGQRHRRLLSRPGTQLNRTLSGGEDSSVGRHPWRPKSSCVPHPGNRTILPAGGRRRFVSDAHDPAVQYRTSAALESRYSIYHYSRSGRNWHDWLFDHISFPPNGFVLDIGCGPATLWIGRTDRLPAPMQVTLADQSPGMLDDARKHVGTDTRFAFVQAWVDHLPFETAAFDVVLALHMLYHADSLPRATGELRRVLRPGGRCFVSTASLQHLAALRELLKEYDQSLVFPSGRILAFASEHAPTYLRPVFPEIESHSFVDRLLIPDADAIVRYYLSIFDGNGYPDLRGQRDALTEHVRRHIHEHGPLETDSRTDLFICRLA